MQRQWLLLLLLPLSFPVILTRELLCGGSPEPCANGGTCLRLSQGQGTCQCAPGFLGETCQFPDPCWDTQLCENGGSCQALLPTAPSSHSPTSPLTPHFSCTCPSGFTGDRCQSPLEELCPPSFCSNGGHCSVQVSGRPQCSCEPGWTGEQCQLRDFCSANPCANGGVCLATYPQIQCRCPTGFEGHICERDVNECFLEPGPCPRGTSCHNTLGSFQCLCPVGQEGPQCKLRKGACLPGTCLNGGTCQLVPEGDTTFHLCLCPPGFTGLDCEMNPDDCVRNQCQNGATCQDGLGTYTCLCPKTWKGWARSGSPATPRLLWVGGRGGRLTERGVATPRALSGLSLPQRRAATAAERASRRCFSRSLSSSLRLVVSMARGNQREIARQKNMKKTQEISKGKRKEDSLTASQRKQRDSEIMQQKQKVANEKKSMQTRDK